MRSELDRHMLTFLRAVQAAAQHAERFTEIERAAIVEAVCHACLSSRSEVAICGAQTTVKLTGAGLTNCHSRGGSCLIEEQFKSRLH